MSVSPHTLGPTRRTQECPRRPWRPLGTGPDATRDVVGTTPSDPDREVHPIFAGTARATTKPSKRPLDFGRQKSGRGGTRTYTDAQHLFVDGTTTGLHSSSKCLIRWGHVLQTFPFTLQLRTRVFVHRLDVPSSTRTARGRTGGSRSTVVLAGPQTKVGPPSARRTRGSKGVGRDS